jgi:quinoprotein glucose dehydrogenase
MFRPLLSITCLALLPAFALAQHGTPDRSAAPLTYTPEVKAASDEAAQAVAGVIVHDGFRLELVAAEPLLANPVCFAVDASMRFYVAETFRLHAGVTDMRSHMDWLDEELACRTVEDRVAMMRRHEGEQFEARHAREHERLRLLTDTDGDGLLDRAQVFADGFSNPAAGIAAGVLPLGKDVYYACIPDLWLLRDENGDGVADRRRSLHSGWGVHVALLGHDMHGLQRGPDGRLYWSIGDRGFNVQHEGKTLVHPHAGAVLRSELDGSGLEIFATGLRNPQELVFDDHGNLWTGDNNSDGGDRARWVYVMEGAEIGWRHAYQYITSPNLRGPWNAEQVWMPPHAGQPAYVVPPVANFSDGPSGVTYYPGTGFGPDWRGTFFLCDFRGGPAASGVHAFRVEAKGAGFELVDPKHFLWNCLPTDVDFAPDGNLYVSDWVNGWGMTGKGRLYRVTTDAFAEERAEIRGLLGEGMSQRSDAELGALLTHGHRQVRLEAQWALAERGAVEPLLARATDRGAGTLARLHGLWGLGQIMRARPSDADGLMSELLSLHDDRDEEVRTQFMGLLGEQRWSPAAPLAMRALGDSSPRVRSFAARALGRMGQARAFRPLVELLASNDDRDPWLRHGAVWALVCLGDAEGLGRLASDPRAAVRRGAVVALRRLQSSAIARFLGDEDRSIVAEAARAIYDVPIPAAMGPLAELLPSISASDEHYLARRVLLAGRWQGDAQAAERIAAWLADGGHPQAMGEALGILRDWQAPSPRDPMTGEWRPRPTRPPGEVRPAIEGLGAAGIVRRLDEPGQRAWVSLLNRHPDTTAALALLELAVDRELSWRVRRDALEAALRRQSFSPEDLLARACEDPDGRVRALAYEHLGRLDPVRATGLAVAQLDGASQAEAGAALLALGRIDHPDARAALQASGLFAGRPETRGVLLEVIEAFEAQGLDSTLEYTHQEALAKEPELAPMIGHLYALAGGDPAAGRRVFLEKAETNCLRCHALSDQGGSEVGPELTGVGGRLTRRELLLSILDPNQSVAAEFENWVFALDDGTVASGRILSEDGEWIVVETPQKETLEIAPDEVSARRRDLSSMPQDISSHLSRRELRDLLAFLAGEK